METQTALWNAEAKARGAKANDIADIYALAQVIAFAALTGRRANAKGFQLAREDFGYLFGVQISYLRELSAQDQQKFAETAFLHGSDTLRLRRASQVAGAQKSGREFLDSWANGKTPGATRLLTPLSSAPATKKAATKAATRKKR